MDFWRIQTMGIVPSTQDLVRGLAEVGEPEGLAVQALQQSLGRGRHGNAWTSPMGNLYLSVLLRPKCTAAQAGQLAFVCALALSAAMDEVIDVSSHNKALKWPNDILIDGKKVSGLLLESSIAANGRVDYIILGSGVNIFAAPEGAIGLDAVKAQPIFVNKFRDVYLGHLLAHYRAWQDKGFAFVRDAWLKQAHGLGEDMTIRLPEISYRGIFRGVDENGALQAEIDGQMRTFTAGEVHFGVKE